MPRERHYDKEKTLLEAEPVKDHPLKVGQIIVSIQIIHKNYFRYNIIGQQFITDEV